VATFADGKIEAYVGPVDLGAADDLEAVIVDFIAGSKKSLDIAVQELDSEPIAQAILVRGGARRGQSVASDADPKRGESRRPGSADSCGHEPDPNRADRRDGDLGGMPLPPRG
jgi:hypothetical protein